MNRWYDDNLSWISCASFVLTSFMAAGTVQVLWLRSQWSRYFARPLDGGRQVRGRRLWGENKTWRGLIVMIPAVGLMFLLLGGGREMFGPRFADGIWPLTAGWYFALGCWVGLAFMLAELPNSLLKRQLGIAPGDAPQQQPGRAVCFLLDQTDSVAGGLIGLALCVPVPWQTWLVLLAAGPFVHWLFNVVLRLLGLKHRAA